MIIQNKNSFEIKNQISDNASNRIDLSIFDKIYCFHYIPYDDRKQSLISEFKRIGIDCNSQKFTWQYTVPNKYYDLLFYGNQKFIDTHSVNVTNINYTVNSYNMLKIAYDLGYERILVLEDDIRFLKNQKLLNSYLANIPYDYDLVMFEYFIWDQNKDFKSVYEKMLKNEINKYYLKFTVETIFDTGMFMLSRKMIKHIIDNDEICLEPFDGYTRFKNTLDDNDLKRAISKIPLCIQKEYANRQECMEDIDKYSMFNKKEYNV